MISDAIRTNSPDCVVVVCGHAAVQRDGLEGQRTSLWLTTHLLRGSWGRESLAALSMAPQGLTAAAGSQGSESAAHEG